MNPVQERILERLATLPSELSVLKEFATRHARYCSSITRDDTLQIAHQPWLAPEGYAIRLFAPAKKAWFAKFKERTGRPIPAGYRAFLGLVNGCTAYGLSLYGLPPSMQGVTPTLDRARLQPLDLDAANLRWMREYAVDGGAFHFGGRAWSADENVGYFWLGEELRAVRKSGAVVGEWPDLSALLSDELSAAEHHATERTPTEWWH